jgi:hypothetical protein
MWKVQVNNIFFPVEGLNVYIPNRLCAHLLEKLIGIHAPITAMLL